IDSPPRAPPVQYATQYGTRWQKEKAAAGQGAFEYPEDAKYVGPWVIGECVGKGASGHVKIARHRRTGQLAAIKILPLDLVFSSRTSLRSRQAKSDKQRLGIDREIIMMKLMNHPNIMRIYDVYEGDNELYLILEYVEGGELFDFLVNRGKLPPAEALAYFKQIIYGLNYAHAFSIIHRDLKPENILIHSLQPPLIKIADWGMAAFAPPSLQLETSCGSPHYASPEIVNGHKYSGTATDIWSCGVILFALLTGRLPFDDKNVRTLLSKVKTGKYDLPPTVDPQARDLIQRMLVVDVSHRISIPDILAHPWLSHDTPGIVYVPAPPVSQLARPLPSAAHIDPDLLESLCVIWGRHADVNAVTAELLSPPGSGTLAKAFYFLLQTHRVHTLESEGIVMDVDPRAKAVTKLYSAPLSKKPRPFSVGTEHIFKFAPPPMERNSTAPPAYHQPQVPQVQVPALHQPMWQQILSPPSPTRRSRPISPAGPRPRPISTPSPAHAHSNFHPHRSTQTVVAAPRAPFPAGYAERPLPNPFLSAQSPPGYPASTPGTRTSLMLPLAPAAPPSPGVYAPIPILPAVSAPRIDNVSFQRTIDDIAGRMNVLNAAFAHAQVQARAEAMAMPSATHYTNAVGRRSTDEERDMSRSSDASSGVDKENAVTEHISKKHGDHEGPVLNGLGFGKGVAGLGKDVGNIAIQEQLRRAPTGKMKKIKREHHSSPFLQSIHVSFPSPGARIPSTLARLAHPRLAQVSPWFSCRRRGQRVVLQPL
ncbi:Pkinase-domain-containing protein, partial [Auriscalpium vulgare]